MALASAVLAITTMEMPASVDDHFPPPPPKNGPEPDLFSFGERNERRQAKRRSKKKKSKVPGRV